MYASLTCTWYEKHIALGLLKIEHFRRQTKKKKKKTQVWERVLTFESFFT